MYWIYALSNPYWDYPLETLQIRPTGADTFALTQRYRLLNCSYRVAAFGGTDKMQAGMPVSGVRAYARLSEEDMSSDVVMLGSCWLAARCLGYEPHH